ncbi:carboxypeptidase B-like [Bicyclus anynana]|uniref:Carboxypeptidase B-like n=1 Tax=Bicyclus anynana TaxID=110368 RepID=A0A6J1P012_BICAN|nr:carboxypeptidase B-like [Bicyclus anynana]
MLKYILFFAAAICLTQAKHEEYFGHSLYGVRVHTMEQAQLLIGLVERLYLDIWSYPNPLNEGLILVAPNKKAEFEKFVLAINATCRIDTMNIKEKLDLEDQLMEEAHKKSNASRSERFGLSFDVIHRFAVVDRYLVDVANRFPRVARVVSAGRSVEGRDIKYLRLSTDNFTNRNKPVIFIQSLLHAREWVTLPVTLWAIQELVINVTDQDLIRDIDWIILPIANPDGYEFSHTTTRMWRKNRRRGHHASCVGVDPNRNYDYFWGTASSRDPCSETFHGPRAFSEPETQITRNIINAFRDRMRLYLDIHSFGSMILFGFAAPAPGRMPPNVDTLRSVGTQMARAIDAVKWRNHPNYRVGNVAQLLSVASGGGTDWALHVMPNRLSYAYELPAYRNQRTVNGFLVEPAFIRQAGFETWRGIRVAARFVVRNRALFED